MSKRSWDEAHANDGPSLQAASSSGYGPADEQHIATDGSSTKHVRAESMPQYIPMISRKVKACAACRKHKIKCIMESGPPCKRCVEKKLGCVLNKSLQTLISERSQSSEAMVQDLEMIHASLQQVTKALNLPRPGRLQSTRQMPHTPTSEEPSDSHHLDEVLPSCDASPGFSPEDDNDLPKVPIQSLYHLTKLSALRSPETSDVNNISKQRGNSIDDFISRGFLSLEDADRLYRLYMDHLDHFMYGIGGRHKTLDALRRNSRILSVAILTVAALHDPQSNAIYGVCSKEFRRLLAASVFNRRIDRDYLRAMCVASYWLSEINWTVSGYAIRRAAEFNLTSHYNRVINDGNEEAADYVRLWYVLYICDQHLSTLYGRPSVIREDRAIQGWEAFIKSPITTDEDKRLASQVALLNIMHSIRDLLGPDTGEPVPQVYLMQITSFGRQLDQWLGQWSTVLLEHHEQIGSFPRKGVLLHYHFAKLHLYSHVFRGLRNTPIPPHFAESAASATVAAVAIINALITDPEMQPALIGIPSYMHSMTAFACMFLAKLAMVHGDQLIERAVVIDLISRLVDMYKCTAAGKFHLVNLMAEGLEKIVKTLRESNEQMDTHNRQDNPVETSVESHNWADFGDPGFLGDNSLFDANFLMDYNMNLGASAMYLGNGPAVFETTDLSPSFL